MSEYSPGVQIFIDNYPDSNNISRASALYHSNWRQMMPGKLQKALSGKSALVAGGSRGIGKAVAAEFVKHGGSVCVAARSAQDLDSAAEEIAGNKISDDQAVDTLSIDCTDHDQVIKELSGYYEKRGVPDYLFNFVGYAHPDYIQNLTFQHFKDNMETNYYGQLNPILATIPYYMKEKRGHVITCSSVVGYLGHMGYATYGPSKFAIAGLSEMLRHELKPYQVRFSVVYPPDTATPGMEKENQTKPKEVFIISEGGGLMSPEEVAKKLLKDSVKGKFYIHPGQSKLLWTMTRHFPRLVHSIMDRELVKAMKKTGRKV
jgi:3-dehydrosphinganine reductase